MGTLLLCICPACPPTSQLLGLSTLAPCAQPPLQWYLVPETGGLRGVQLYRATRFPTAWELLSVPVEPEQALQGVGLVHHAGHWWLLGSQPSARPGEGPGLRGRAVACRQACPRVAGCAMRCQTRAWFGAPACAAAWRTAMPSLGVYCPRLDTCRWGGS